MPLIITLILGLVLIVDFYFADLPVITTTVPMLSKWATIIAGFAVPYSVAALLISHAKTIQKRTPGRWYFSLWMIVIMVIMLYLGLTEGMDGENYTGLYNNMAGAVNSTVSGMLGLYAMAAAFRAWHARTPEAFTMIIAGFLVILGLIAPIGEAIWPGFVPLANFFNDYVFKAERTVFYIGTSIAAILMGIRTLIGEETSYMAVEE